MQFACLIKKIKREEKKGEKMVRQHAIGCGFAAPYLNIYFYFDDNAMH